ncbi:ABC transporter permease [Burkholderiaceae bacterium DAT-1]|nr:ABC transporter permease [Burkholderiaceae bacterium DAT-1]
MNLARLALRQVLSRPLHSVLNIVLLALGVATVVLILQFDAQLQDRMLRDGERIDLVVGAKGSPLQLILSSVYQADIPTGNIPKAEADQLARHPLIARAIPISMGDSAAGHRILGTTPDYIELYEGKLVSGALWQAPLEVVLGANVASHTGWQPGQTFAGSHGLGEGGEHHDDHPYRVTGILAPTGTILDDLVLTSLESVWAVHEHHDKHPASSDPDREITALLIQYTTPLAVLKLPRQINAESKLQATSPALESARLLNVVGIGLQAFRGFAVILTVSALLSMFVALYTTLEARRHDLAVMRMMGCSPSGLLMVILLEGWLLAGISTLAGLGLGHLALSGAGHLQLAPALHLTGWHWLNTEWLILLTAPVTGTLAALIPAIRAYRTDIALVLANQ